jgi:hypothetical protein
VAVTAAHVVGLTDTDDRCRPGNAHPVPLCRITWYPPTRRSRAVRHASYHVTSLLTLFPQNRALRLPCIAPTLPRPKWSLARRRPMHRCGHRRERPSTPAQLTPTRGDGCSWPGTDAGDAPLLQARGIVLTRRPRSRDSSGVTAPGGPVGRSMATMTSAMPPHSPAGSARGSASVRPPADAWKPPCTP